jgi:hypothetical protein
MFDEFEDTKLPEVKIINDNIALALYYNDSNKLYIIGVYNKLTDTTVYLYKETFSTIIKEINKSLSDSNSLLK